LVKNYINNIYVSITPSKLPEEGSISNTSGKDREALITRHTCHLHGRQEYHKKSLKLLAPRLRLQQSFTYK
jgi:hypothetical protein